MVRLANRFLRALEIPEWLTKSETLKLLLRLVGWRCWCGDTTRVFRDTQGYYTRCLECGRRIPYYGALTAENVHRRFVSSRSGQNAIQ